MTLRGITALSPLRVNHVTQIEKAKKEKNFRLLEEDFIKGTEFDSFEDLNHRAHLWLDHLPGAGNLRVHGTTGRMPNEAWLSEKELLIRLPDKRFPFAEEEPRDVDLDSTLSIHGVKYTVPSKFASTTVKVRLYAEYFEVLNRTNQLEYSRGYKSESDKRNLLIDNTHYATLKSRPPSHDERLPQAFLKRFPSLALFVAGLQRKMKSIAPIHIRTLIRLSDTYGEEAFLSAALRVQQARRFDASAVKRILEKEVENVLDDYSTPLGGRGADIAGEIENDGLDSFSHLDTQVLDEPKTKNKKEK